MSGPLVLDLLATRQALEEALAEIEAHCRAHSIDGSRLMKLLLIVEELFSNTLKYGYGGEGRGRVRLQLRAEEALTLTFEDDAPEFDPTGWDVEQSLGAEAEERPIGQTGIALVMGLAARVDYEREDPTNRLILAIA